MSFLDSLQSTIHKVLPEKKPKMQSSSSGGIGNGHVPFDDDVSPYFWETLDLASALELRCGISCCGWYKPRQLRFKSPTLPYVIVFIFMSFQHPPTLTGLHGGSWRLSCISSIYPPFIDHMDLGSYFLYDCLLISILTRRLLPTDDCIQTHDHIPYVSSILQLPCSMLLLQLRCVPTEMGSGPLYVPLNR